MSKQPKALELAEQLENYWLGPSLCSVKAPAADLLRSQHQQLKELCEALERICGISNKDFGGDWEEIEEARQIAAYALSRIKEQQ